MSQWVHIDDELPRDRGEVLVWQADPECGGEVAIARFDPTAQETYQRFWRPDKTDDDVHYMGNWVTHWMPLPCAPNVRRVARPSVNVNEGLTT